ncbi:TPA: PD-(D/E)XK nuclease family protein [Yersinia enterocolitica]|uniref:PDDEXK-like family protein n=1 Tax=Yersinia enterocolitica TaxID=630 RepID=UPI0032FF00DC|nr:PD-(D/E)XK nuclease family protein [Yersinia enterocolitica]EKN5927935.1 PD-(D/E)XK nuclease [Yersinia enterocolitica]HDL7361200.1 PD-(D/E)XK nuclease family protein [Yersinia enterocolitica]HDL7410436.1 PD-(D/E)XK nuclease family protein [Yersinia enterocolitica]
MENINTSLVEWLPDFFQQWPQNIRHGEDTEKKTNIDSNQLAAFFTQLEEPLKAIQHRSLVFDPWEVAGLERKEVQNTGVLAWLLDPCGSHGFGRLPMQTLLESIRNCCRDDIPKDFMRYCRVQVETNPTGDNTNRVDIEIDADNFFLLIEVKIDASEQKEQISRYCSDARQRAVRRPWAVVFLTPRGGKPLTCGLKFKPADVPCLSWRHLAAAMEISLQSSYKQIVAADNASPMRQMATQAAFCFLARVRKF